MPRQRRLSHLAALTTLVVLSTGCPSEPPAVTNLVPSEPGAGGAGGGEPGPQTQPGAVQIDLSSHQAQQTQEQIGAGEFITVAGTVSGDCAGSVTLEAIPGASSDMQGGGPLTIVTLSGAGPFSLKSPKGQGFRLAGFCDGNGDSKIEPGLNGDGATPQPSFAATEDVTGVELALGSTMVVDSKPSDGQLGEPPPTDPGAAGATGAASPAPPASGDGAPASASSASPTTDAGAAPAAAGTPPSTP